MPDPVRPLLAVLLAGFLVLAPARQGIGQSAAGVDQAKEYSACMSLARTQPEDAFESALAWADRGGGDAARHCAAVALIGLGHYAEAARRLEALAEALAGREPGLRLDVLVQAGQAWLLADQPARAHAVQSAALTLDPDNVELLIDRSITLALARNYWEAIDDLNRASDLAPNRSDILIYRATAYRYVDALDLALEDIGRALFFEPDNPEALLERGILRRLGGDEAGAREDWLAVVTLAEGTPAADAAQANLANLDVKAD